MSDISERCWFAGWMDGTEFEVWRLATVGGDWGRESAADLQVELSEASALAKELGVWLALTDKPGCDHEPIDLTEWRRRYKAWSSRDIQRR